uniref:Uncharacterized protein n=1 Tax=viral metagenome TaxID=1070528 RepID=A0A6M3L5K1_9ZZZZ
MNFNNWLAAGVVGGCFLVALLQGRGIVNVPEFIQGALYTVGFTLVIQFYFRKKEGE